MFLQLMTFYILVIKIILQIFILI